MISIGEKIKLYREAQKFSQQEFALKIGISKGHLSRIESGEDKPSGGLLERIATTLDMDVKKLKPTLSRAQKTNYMRVLTEEELLKEYNLYHAIIVKLLKSSVGEMDELFPAILGIQDGKIAAFYNNRKEPLLLSNYREKWIAYKYHEDIIDEDRNDQLYEG